MNIKLLNTISHSTEVQRTIETRESHFHFVFIEEHVQHVTAIPFADFSCPASCQREYLTTECKKET